MTIQITSTTDSPEAVQAAMDSPAHGGEKKTEAKSAPETKSSTEQKKSPESDPVENETDEDQSDESEADDSQEPEAKDSENEKPKKKGGFQRRIDKLNQRASAAQQEAEYWKEQALKGASGPKSAEKVETPKADQAGKPDPDKFETHAEYVEALTDWKIEVKDKAKAAEARQSQLKTEQENAMKSHSERVNAFKEKTDNFMEVLENVDDLPVSPAVQELIVTSDHGPELMYELAKNRAEYERINKLSPLAAARELGKIESRIAAQSPDPKKTESKKITKAPQPISPVGQKGGASEKSPDEMPYQEYKKWREAQLSRR